MLDRGPGTPPVETALQTPGSQARLPQGYRLEYGSDALILRQVDGSFAAAFSPHGATAAAVGRAAEEDSLG